MQKSLSVYLRWQSSESSLYSNCRMRYLNEVSPMLYKVTGAGHRVCVCVCVCGGGGLWVCVWRVRGSDISISLQHCDLNRAQKCKRSYLIFCKLNCKCVFLYSVYFSLRGLASTLPSVPNLWLATCPRTNRPYSTGCGTLWCLLYLNTPYWRWLPLTPLFSWWR